MEEMQKIHNQIASELSDLRFQVIKEGFVGHVSQARYFAEARSALLSWRDSVGNAAYATFGRYHDSWSNMVSTAKAFLFDVSQNLMNAEREIKGGRDTLDEIEKALDKADF